MTDSLSDWQAVAVMIPQDTCSWLDIYFEWKMARVVVRNGHQKHTSESMCSKLTIVGLAVDMLARPMWSFKEEQNLHFGLLQLNASQSGFGDWNQ